MSLGTPARRGNAGRMPAGLPRASAVLHTGAARVVHTAVSVLHGVQPPTVGNIAQRRGATSDAPAPPACALGARPQRAAGRELLDTATSSTSAALTATRRPAIRSSNDELRIEHDQGDVEIVVYTRAILLFFTDSEALKRIHQVCCSFETDPQRVKLRVPGRLRVNCGQWRSKLREKWKSPAAGTRNAERRPRPKLPVAAVGVQHLVGVRKVGPHDCLGNIASASASTQRRLAKTAPQRNSTCQVLQG